MSKSRNNAFTLIELLVVIAIIAILAAILFPVFAQAKVAAKKAQSISGLKQQSISTAIYTTDYDDVFPMHAYVNVGGAFPDDRVYWPQAVQPYMKNWQIMRDPMQTSDPLAIWSTPAYMWYYNWMRWPDYGYNATYLNRDPDCGSWQALGFGFPVSATTPADIAATVMFTTNKVVGTSTGAYTSQVTEAPATILIDDACTWSNGAWGIGSYGDTANWYPGNPTSTGTVAINYSKGSNVSFTDSHVKYIKPGQLAAGTDWKVGVANNAINLTNRSAYIWDLN